MKIWNQIDVADIPGSAKKLTLFQCEEDFSIRLEDGYELMNSQSHGSEDALAELPCGKIRHRERAHVLVGGLGLGFTLASALKHLQSDAKVTVAEMVPRIVEWAKGPLAELNSQAMNDSRVSLYPGDVAKIVKQNQKAFDAILFDLDEGPEGPGSKKNDWLYSENGLTIVLSALTTDGILAIWSRGTDKAFVNRLTRAGFSVQEKRVRAHNGKGAHFIIWLAQKAKKKKSRR